MTAVAAPLAPPPRSSAATLRLHKLGSHIRPPTLTTTTSIRGQLGLRRGSVAGEAAAPPPKLLSTQQVKDFIVNGFLQLKVDELPPGFHENFYETAKQLRNESRDALWATLTPDVNVLLATPTCHGAVQSLLGRDYFMAPGNSHMHVSHAGDQGFHKDGTDHGPTQGTVRDHRPRHLLVLFYPQDTTLEMVRRHSPYTTLAISLKKHIYIVC